VAGGGEVLGHEDVRAVVADTHGGVGAGDEFAEQHGEGAKKRWDAEMS
jgi:hypothetical protein